MSDDDGDSQRRKQLHPDYYTGFEHARDGLQAVIAVATAARARADDGEPPTQEDAIRALGSISAVLCAERSLNGLLNKAADWDEYAAAAKRRGMTAEDFLSVTGNVLSGLSAHGTVHNILKRFRLIASNTYDRFGRIDGSGGDVSDLLGDPTRAADYWNSAAPSFAAGNVFLRGDVGKLKSWLWAEALETDFHRSRTLDAARLEATTPQEGDVTIQCGSALDVETQYQIDAYLESRVPGMVDSAVSRELDRRRHAPPGDAFAPSEYGKALEEIEGDEHPTKRDPDRQPPAPKPQGRDDDAAELTPPLQKKQIGACLGMKGRILNKYLSEIRFEKMGRQQLRIDLTSVRKCDRKKLEALVADAAP